MVDWFNDVPEPPVVTRADFHPGEFEALAHSEGIAATWWTAARCPCGKPFENAPWPTCPVCDGRGWEFFAQQAVDLTAVGFSRDFQGQFERFNTMMSGRAMFSVRWEHAPAYMDRIIPTQARMSKSEMLVRRSDPAVHGHIERLLYPVVPMTYTKPDGTTGSKGVIHLRIGTTDNQAGITLVEGTDFTVTTEGYLDFTLGDASGRAPGKGRHFNLYYKTRPVYRVVSQQHMVRETRTKLFSTSVTGEHLPVQFAAQLEWLVEEGV